MAVATVIKNFGKVEIPSNLTEEKTKNTEKWGQVVPLFQQQLLKQTSGSWEGLPVTP